jgi:hypothetical protein
MALAAGSNIEGAITGKQLATTNGALFSIATRHVKLFLENTAIMTGVLVSSPVVVLVTVTNTWNDPSLESVRTSLLSSHNLLRPAFTHRYAAIGDALALGHWSLPRVIATPFFPSFLEFRND